MDADQARALRDLVRGQDIAALGTLHEGEPYVSMVPYAQPAGGADFFIHVSRLAAHTRDMIASPRVSLLIIARSGDTPQSRARVTIRGDASALAAGSAEYASAKACYIARFPHTGDIFELADFSIFRIQPISVRVVGGFAQAYSLGAESFARALRESWRSGVLATIHVLSGCSLHTPHPALSLAAVCRIVSRGHT